jgi:hypothetical protein
MSIPPRYFCHTYFMATTNWLLGSNETIFYAKSTICERNTYLPHVLTQNLARRRTNNQPVERLFLLFDLHQYFFTNRPLASKILYLFLYLIPTYTAYNCKSDPQVFLPTIYLIVLCFLPVASGVVVV